MQLETFDLNLLRALELLLSECSVTRAATQMNVTQSAMSGMLRRLRDQFGDELLVMSGRTMRPTPRGAELLAPVRNVLQLVRKDIIGSTPFDPASSPRHFSIGSSDYTTFAIVDPLLQAAAGSAPRMRFTVARPMLPLTPRLERGEIDVVLLPERAIDAAHPSRFLLEDDYAVLACARNREIEPTISKSFFFAHPHIGISDHGLFPTAERWLQSNYGQRRNVQLSVPSYYDVPKLLVGTSRLAVVHSRLADDFVARYPLIRRPVPLSIPAARICAQWHAINIADPGIAWLVEEMASACGTTKPAHRPTTLSLVR